MDFLKNNKAARIAAWSLGGLLALVVLLPLSLYIPFVQNIVKDVACKYASDATGMTITIDRILIKFPLDVSVDSALVLDEKRDTMVRADNVTASVAMLPLLKLDVEVSSARLSGGQYRMLSEDSSMLLTAHVALAKVDGVGVDLNKNEVRLVNGELTGGDISLDYYQHKVKEKEDTTSSEPWHVVAGKITLRDIDYTMAMMPTIERLTTHVGFAELDKADINTGTRVVDAQYLGLDSVDVAYYTPSAKRAAAYSKAYPIPVDTVQKPVTEADTATWTVRGDSIRLNGGHAIYAITGAKPVQGLDVNYIEISDLAIGIDDLYNRGLVVDVPIKSLVAKERSGLQIKSGSGRFKMDDNAMEVLNLDVATMLSNIKLNAYVENALLDEKPSGHMSVETDSRIALQEVGMLMSSMKPMLKGIPQYNPVSVKANVGGNFQKIDIRNFVVDLPRYAHAQVTGNVKNPTNINKLAGDLKLDCNFANINFVKPTLLDKATAKQVNFPPMKLKANAHFAGTSYSGDLDMRLATGSLVGKGSFNGKGNAYSLDANLSTFPVNALLPLMGIGDVTARVQLSGHGFDFLKPSTSLNANVDLSRIVYNKIPYNSIVAKVNMNAGNVEGSLKSGNRNADLDVAFKGTVANDAYSIDFDGTINDLDLAAFNMYKGVCHGEGKVTGFADLNMRTKYYEGSVNLTDVNWYLDSDEFVIPSADATFQADSTQTKFNFNNEDNHIAFESPCMLDEFIKRMENSQKIAMNQYDKMVLNLDTLQQALPPFSLALDMGADGVIQRYMDKYDVGFRDVFCEINNDSTIFMDGWVHGLSVGTTNIDTISIKANEVERDLAYKLHMGNRRGTMDEFAQVDLSGNVKGSTLTALLEQQNIKHKTGYRVGLNATLEKEHILVKFFPKDPVIYYRDWTVNDSNYIDIDYAKKQLAADLRLQSDSSLVMLTSGMDVDDDTKQNIRLQVQKLKLEEWIGMIPGMTPMSGEAAVDMQLSFDGKNLLGDGDVSLHNFEYNGERVGNIEMLAKLTLDPATGSTHLDGTMDLNGSKVAVAYGSLNDSTAASPFNLAMKIDRLPLENVSPFIPGGYLKLGGFLNGDLSVTGSMDKPIVSGNLKGDSATVTLPEFGAELKLSEDAIPIDSSVIRFNNYKIYGLNDRAVSANGTVDFKDLDNMQFNLALKGSNVQFMGSKQRPESMLFGNAFANLDATVRGRGNFMIVNADVSLLPTTNITYVMQDDVSTLTSTVDEDMVTFVNLNDPLMSVDSIRTNSSSMGMNVNATLRVPSGAKINAYLSTDGKDRVTVSGSGTFRYTQDFAGKTNLVGRYEIDEGEARYSPPLISQKIFQVTSGSSLSFTGDMMNPALDITATEEVKSSVSGSDNTSRLVDFVITCKVGNTLSNMDLNFDLSTDNDLTVSNELQSMTAAQRSNAAMNMLLYNTYSGTNSMSTSGLTTESALYSFLQSQLNSWAASTLKGVDLSFGINQYSLGNGDGTSTQTSYSYRLSKSLFNERFKVVVGGEYSTEASSEENFSQNLISDVSLEYYLNQSGTKYFRLFRHTGYESVLEGEIVQMGAGFVMKRKVSSLSHLFRYKRSKPADDAQPVETQATDTTTAMPTKNKKDEE